MRSLLIAVFVLAAVPALASDKMSFWNQTDREMTGVYLAPAGSTAFGSNQALNDPDKSVSSDERLAITGVKPGRYDVKLVDTHGRTCMVRGVDVKGTGRVAFIVPQSQLSDCR